MKQSTRRQRLILFTGSLLLARAPAAFAQKTPGGSSGGAEVSLLNVSQYSSYFVDCSGKTLDSKYGMATTDADWNKFSAVEGAPDDIDTPLEIALLSYYSKPVIKIRPPEAQKELPANSKDSALKLGAATYMEMQVNKYLGSAKGAGEPARYATMLKFIEKKSGVTQAEIVNYMKEGIGGVVDKYYGQKQSLDIIPANVYADWQRKGVYGGKNGVQIVKNTLDAFYLNPTRKTFAALVGIDKSYFKNIANDPLADGAERAFINAVDDLSDPLFMAIANDSRSASQAIADAGSAGKDLGIFSIPYTAGSQ
jgi:hypothetical protein